MTFLISYMPGRGWCVSMTNDELWAIGVGATPWQGLAACVQEIERLWFTDTPGPDGSLRVGVCP